MIIRAMIGILGYNEGNQLEWRGGVEAPLAVTPEGLIPMLRDVTRHRFRCAVCSSEFVSYNPNPTYCSNWCRSEGLAADIDIPKLKLLYESGNTQDEIAALFGVSQKSIFKAMKRHGIPARVAAKRNQFGERNHKWRGDSASKSAMHIRLYRRFGQASECSFCGTTDTSLWYDWANLTGHYEDINDYQRMCRSCHRQYDMSRREEVMPSDAA